MNDNKIEEPRIFVMMAGIPGSGKSTLAKLIARSLNAQVISTDKVREEFLGDEACQDYPELIFSNVYNRIETYAPYVNVVYDATNYRKNYRKETLEHVFGRYDLIFCVFQYTTPTLKDCLRNNKMRSRQVPDNVIVNMWNRFDYPDISEGFDAKIPFSLVDNWLEDLKEGDPWKWKRSTSTHSEKTL